MGKQKRDIPILFWVNEDEKQKIRKKMELTGVVNMSAYLRKMAIDGYTIRLDLPEVKEMVSLLRYAGNNLNQLTRRVHETGRFYDADLEDVKRNQEKIWDAANTILHKLSKIQ